MLKDKVGDSESNINVDTIISMVEKCRKDGVTTEELQHLRHEMLSGNVEKSEAARLDAEIKRVEIELRAEIQRVKEQLLGDIKRLRRRFRITAIILIIAVILTNASVYSYLTKVLH
ncbi:MAG: hypothetical protein HQL06_01490 [Nitrospirae bacterium]|nr:hypothetical protein [Nitrospirota bacterium]